MEKEKIFKIKGVKVHGSWEARRANIYLTLSVCKFFLKENREAEKRKIKKNISLVTFFVLYYNKHLKREIPKKEVQ